MSAQLSSPPSTLPSSESLFELQSSIFPAGSTVLLSPLGPLPPFLVLPIKERVGQGALHKRTFAVMEYSRSAKSSCVYKAFSEFCLSLTGRAHPTFTLYSP